MPRRRDHTREELRELFVSVAQRLVRASGPSALTARSVAQGVGYAPGTLYLVFRNLNDLILAVNSRTLEQLEGELLAQFGQADGGRAQARALTRAYVRFAAKEPHLWRLAFSHQLAQGEQAPDWLGVRLERAQELIERSLLPVMGHLPQETCARTAARALWGGVHGVTLLAQGCVLSQGEMSETDALALTDTLVDHFLSGLGAAAARTAN